MLGKFAVWDGFEFKMQLKIEKGFQAVAENFGGDF